jgi:acetolactate synthase-like protein
MNGGERMADVLVRRGVKFVFTLCGGHISPILVGAKARGLRVVDTRHEATAVFAADAVARLTGVPGFAAVTAGPGVTNTITALKNAQMARSPLVLVGGATATLLRGRGALQDIDQMALVRPHVKKAARVGRVADLAPALDEAFRVAAEGVPGPVFLEAPVDLLYPEALVREWYGAKTGGSAASLRARAERWYVGRHLARVFGAETRRAPRAASAREESESAHRVALHRQRRLEAHGRRLATRLVAADRPVLLIGSQAVLDPSQVHELADAVRALGVPVFLSGMARGLLGPADPLQMRHRRKEALREADLVVLAGVPVDFRLDYGRHVGRRAAVVSINLSRADLTRNRRPEMGILGSPAAVLIEAGRAIGRERHASRQGGPPDAWREALRARDTARDAEIAAQAGDATPDGLNPLSVCRALDGALADDSIVVADGGDFVSTASYVLRPRGPLSWLDPGPFGTLGVGAGFALGARLARPEADVWILYGDGSLGYSLAEADTFVRHGLGVVAVVGNDGGWTQIAREQVEVLRDDVGTVLAPADYERAAEGLGACGLRLGPGDDSLAVLSQACRIARAGRPVYVNARIGRTGFRKGSISM